MISCASNLKKHCDTVDSVSLEYRPPVLSKSQRDVSCSIYSALFASAPPQTQIPSVLVIAGESGCGKSTVLAYLSTRLALLDAKNQPELLTMPGVQKTSHQILRTILEPYVPWSKTNGYDRHGLLRLLASVIIETCPRPSLFVLDVPSTISEKELDVVAQTIEDLREIQRAVATDYQPPRILIAGTPAINTALFPSGILSESVTTFTLENPTVKDVKSAVQHDLTQTYKPLSRADDTETTAALITAYTHNIHTLGLHPPHQSVFETARLIARRIGIASDCTSTKNAIENAAASLVHEYITPPWVPILNHLIPRYLNHHAYISTYDIGQNWDLDRIWFDIPQALLNTATATAAARPPGLLARHPTIPTKVAVNAPESLVRWLATILAQPKPKPQLTQPTAAKIPTRKPNPYTTCTPNTVAYLAALHTTHRKRPETFDLTHKDVYDEYLTICKRAGIAPIPIRKMYRIGKRLSSQGLIATARMTHTRGRPSRDATLLTPHQLAQLRTTIHTLVHPYHQPSEAELSTLKNTLTKLCNAAPTQHQILNVILALIQKTKKRVLNTADIYTTYSTTATNPISRSAFYTTLARLLKVSHVHITSIATATISITVPPSNNPDPPPP